MPQQRIVVKGKNLKCIVFCYSCMEEEKSWIEKIGENPEGGRVNLTKKDKEKILLLITFKMYDLGVRESLDRIFRELVKKDRISFEYITKKIKEIRENPHHFKPLRAPMKNFRRVHIGNFVLIYSIGENRKTVIIEKYGHHDRVYKS